MVRHFPPWTRTRTGILLSGMCDDAAVPKSILEVIALNAVDAIAAQDGGADRVELVADMARQGLTPSLATFVSVREAVDIPVRVMLRAEDGYGLSDADALIDAASELRAAGADEFVLGFLDARAAVEIAQSLVGAPATDYPALPGWSGTTVSLVGGVFTGGGMVFGTSDGDTVVWGTTDGDTVVWGTGDGDTVVWGTSCSDPNCTPVIRDRP